jgi:hypothetical protein
MTVEEEIERQEKAEHRRFRAAGTFHIAGALIRCWGEERPNKLTLAAVSTQITDAILEHLKETE